MRIPEVYDIDRRAGRGLLNQVCLLIVSATRGRMEVVESAIENAVTTANLSPSFVWLDPDFARLVGTVRRLIVPFVDPTASFSGETWSGGAVVLSKSYKSLDRWIAGLTPELARAQATWRLFQGRTESFTVTAYYETKRISFYMSLAENDLDRAKKLIDNLKVELNLQDQSANDAFKVEGASFSYLEKAYVVVKPNTSEWFIRAADEALGVDKSDVNGTLELASPLGIGQSFGAYDDFAEAVNEHWANLTRVEVSRFKRPMATRIAWDLRSGNCRVRAERRSTEDALAWFEAFERALDLQGRNDRASNQLEGGERTYFAPRDADVKWFTRSVVPSLTNLLGPNSYIDLSARTKSDGGVFSWQNTDRWRQFVIENWLNLSQLRFSLSGPGLTLSFTYENSRERVTMSSRGVTRAAAEQMLSELAEGLSLEEVDLNSAWRIRTTAVYTVRRFGNTKFGEELQAVVKFLFSNKHILNDARVFEPIGTDPNDQDKLKVTIYDRLDRFLARLVEDADYMVAYLRLEGPRGRMLTVALMEKHTKLEIRSSDKPGELKRIFGLLEDNLGLEVITVTSAAPDKTNWKDSGLAVIGLPIFTALLAFVGATIAQDSFRRWIWPVETLEILSPEGASAPPDMELRWQVQREVLGQRRVTEPPTARIIIIGSAIQRLQDGCTASGAKIHLDPGSYALTVVACPNGESATTRFDVKMPSKN